MKASYNWLCSLLPGLKASPREVADRLTRAGLEVEELSPYGAASSSVVVAEVVEAQPHPQRERLTLVTVERGGAKQTVVCGAPNVPPPGRKVVLAPLGTALPAVGLTVARRDIGGVPSEGMLCSEQELGLLSGGGKGDGILVLPEDVRAANGTPLARALASTSDWILDIGVTPNRPDALGHVGIARDVAALFALEFEPPDADAPVKVVTGDDIAKHVAVTIEDTERCPHYGAAVVVDVKIGPSPMWLRHRLESLGVRAISNVVDVTNLVLLEFGQPMHAFDLDTLEGRRVIVRRAARGEAITTIDGVARELSDDDLLIADASRPIALAGVMGGRDTEIGPGASRVLLECAYFTPRGIRRTARRHGLHSEASHRFERGCDPRAVPVVLPHAASLLTRLCHGSALPGTILAGVAPAPERRLRLRRSKLTALLGLDIPLGRASDILTRLGCETARSAERPDEIEVTAPSFRPDIGREEDLVEEVMRVHGIDAIPTTARAVVPTPGRSALTPERRARDAAKALGLSEALTCGFVSRAQLAALGAPEPAVVLRNPLSEERSVMRTSLLPGLLDALRRARRHGCADVRLFTTGRAFLPAPSGSVLPLERLCLAAVLAGERRSGLMKPEPIDVYDAKGIAVELLERVSGRRATVAPARAPHLHPRGAAALLLDGTRVGSFGPLHPDVVDRLDLDGDAYVIDIDLDATGALGYRTPQFAPIPVLPAITRALALVVSEDVLAGSLADTIRASGGELCESVEVFDRFQGKGIPDGHQSLAFELVFRDPKAASDPDHARTLTDQEVKELEARIVDAVKREHGAVVRGAS